MGRMEESQKVLETVAQLKAEDAPGLVNKGNILLRDFNQIEEALECFDKAIELSPAYFLGHMNRGNVTINDSNTQTILHIVIF